MKRVQKIGEDVQKWWTENSEVLKSAEEVLRLTSGKEPPPDKEFLWGSEELHRIGPYLRRKNKQINNRKHQGWKRKGGPANKRTKKVVAEAKSCALDKCIQNWKH